MNCRFKAQHPFPPTVQPIGWYSLRCRLSLESERVVHLANFVVSHLVPSVESVEQAFRPAVIAWQRPALATAVTLQVEEGIQALPQRLKPVIFVPLPQA